MTAYLYEPKGNQATWIDHERVVQFRTELPDAIFRRYYLNEWTSESGSFISERQMSAVVETSLNAEPVGADGWTFYAGLDFGRTVDSTALAIIGKPPDGVAQLLWLQEWQGSADNPVSIIEIEGTLLDIKHRYPAVRVLADPHQLVGSIERLQQRGVQIEPFNMTENSVQTLAHTLHAAITGRSFRMFPHPDLQNEVVRLEVKQRASGWRTDHRSGAHNDLSTALSLALQCLINHPWQSLAESLHFGPTNHLQETVLGG